MINEKTVFLKALENREQKERGASLVEYGLLIALIAVIAIPAVKVLGANSAAKFLQTAVELGSSSVVG